MKNIVSEAPVAVTIKAINIAGKHSTVTVEVNGSEVTRNLYASKTRTSFDLAKRRYTMDDNGSWSSSDGSDVTVAIDMKANKAIPMVAKQTMVAKVSKAVADAMTTTESTETPLKVVDVATSVELKLPKFDNENTYGFKFTKPYTKSGKPAYFYEKLLEIKANGAYSYHQGRYVDLKYRTWRDLIVAGLVVKNDDALTLTQVGLDYIAFHEANKAKVNA